MDIVLIRPTTGARRATRRTALAAALLLASSTLAVSVPQQADAVGPQACTDAFPPVAPALVGGVHEIATEANLVFLSDVGDVSGEPSGDAALATDWASGPKWREQHFVQTAEALDLEGCLFISIGKGRFNGTVPFMGTYDGGGHTISGLLIDEPTVDFVGLFAGVDGGTLRNINLVDPDVTGEEYVGGLAGEFKDYDSNRPVTVENVTITGGRIKAVSRYVGGLAGYLDEGQLRNAHFSGEVLSGKEVFSQRSFAGGLLGMSGGTIIDSSASGSVVGDGEWVGGLVASTWGSITNSSASGSVQGTIGVGGLVSDTIGPITDSYATGEVTGTDEVGGLVGRLWTGGTITDSFATGDVAGEDRVGGLVGDNSGTITDSYATGDVNATSKVGGLIGANNADVTNAFAVGAVGLVAGGTNSGGLIGEQASGTIIDSFWDVDTSGISAADDSSDATGLSTAEMTSLATFDAAWNTGSSVIVEGWQAPSNPTWGICAAVNGGYPFLLWQFDTDPCSTTVTAPATVASAPVLAGGVVPEVPAGQGVWQQADGTSTPLVVSSPAANQLRYEAEGVRVTLTGTTASSPVRGLVADPAGEIVCEVCVPAAAGQVMEVWLFSTPRLVAAHRIDDTECHLFAIPLSAPLDGGGEVTSGAHTLQLALPTASGMQAVNVGMTVGGRVPASVPAGEGSVPFGAVLLALLAAAGVVVAGRRLVAAG